MRDDDTENANHSPVLAMLAGLSYPILFVVGLLGSIVLSLPWAFAAAIVAGIMTGGMLLYGTAILDANRTLKSSVIGLIVGSVISVAIVIVYGWVSLPPGIARDFREEESRIVRMLPVFLFVGLSFLPIVIFHIRQQRAHEQEEQQH
jgi:hypothetical protein